ncbi:uncharacterized protein LOC126829857 [Patella vulgata]|uniref:uncharacterized protein LOC126829857 n=1 Tax=Patella vulgata TaxID=6465 RepID=UPI0024A8746B|nr:uncharacterized protein LOC126829857 [Patella vulgata]
MISTRSVFTKAILTIKQPDCSDAGKYRCVIHVLNDAGIQNLQGDFHLKTGGPSMVVRQPEQSVYPIHAKIRLECSGIATNWTWQWRLPEDRLPWQSFPFTDNVTVGRLSDPPENGTTLVCPGETRTTLTYLAKAQENGVQFRCNFNESDSNATAGIPFTTVCIAHEPSNLKMEVIRRIDYLPSSIVCSGEASIMSEGWRWEWRSPPLNPNWSAYLEATTENNEALNNNNCSYFTSSTLHLNTKTVTDLRCILGAFDQHSLNITLNTTTVHQSNNTDKDCLNVVTSGKDCQELTKLYKHCLSTEEMKKLGCPAAGVGILTNSSFLLPLVWFVMMFHCGF